MQDKSSGPGTLYTIGFQGKSVEEVLDKLKRNGVSLLLDIRENALSRKVGFSKNALASSCEAAGIGYLHRRELGPPRPLRNRLKQTGDYGMLMRKYSLYLKDHVDVLQEIAGLVEEKKICLFCFEHEHAQCHRSALAEKLTEMCGNGMEVVNLQ